MYLLSPSFQVLIDVLFRIFIIIKTIILLLLFFYSLTPAFLFVFFFIAMFIYICVFSIFFWLLLNDDNFWNFLEVTLHKKIRYLSQLTIHYFMNELNHKNRYLSIFFASERWILLAILNWINLFIFFIFSLTPSFTFYLVAGILFHCTQCFLQIIRHGLSVYIIYT